jgi:hypothetical protein
LIIIKKTNIPLIYYFFVKRKFVLFLESLISDFKLSCSQCPLKKPYYFKRDIGDDGDKGDLGDKIVSNQRLRDSRDKNIL